MASRLVALRSRLRRPSNWFEPFMVLVILGGLVRAGLFFYDNGYLPQPFFYDPHDTWMDWFNTAFWAYEPGAYDSWATIYPPLSFVFLRIFSVSHCYAHGADAYAVRNCDWVGLLTLHSLWVLNIVLLWKTFRKVDKSTAFWRTIALGFGLPTMNGLERGNVVIVCMTFVILGFGPLLKSARWRWICVGIAVNFKVYLLTGIFSQLLRRKWLWFEGAFVAVFAIYAMTYMMFGQGTPLELANNIMDAGSIYNNFALTDLWISESYNGFIAALGSNYLMISGSIGTRNTDLLINILPILQSSGKVAIVLAAIAAWYRPESIPMSRLTFLGFGFVMVMSETGGYSEAFLIFFIMQEKWTGLWRKVALVCSYILLIPMDIPIDELPRSATESYLAGHAVFVTYYIALGHFVRPFFVIMSVVAISMLTISDVWVDVRTQGWAGRWRYRRDAFPLPGMVPPWRRPNVVLPAASAGPAEAP